MPNQSAEHNALVAEVLKRYGREPDLTIWRNSKVRVVRGTPMAMPGLCVGASDIVGVLTVDAWHATSTFVAYGWPEDTPCQVRLALGRFVAFEAKTGSAKPTEKQRLFMALIRKRGGFACVFHSAEEFGAALERARRGESE